MPDAVGVPVALHFVQEEHLAPVFGAADVRAQVQEQVAHAGGPADVGQMEFYLRWLKKHEMRPGEDEPLGLILCAEKSDERIELFELAQRGIRVSEYLTELPPKEVLERKLHAAVRLAQARLQAGKRS